MSMETLSLLDDQPYAPPKFVTPEQNILTPNESLVARKKYQEDIKTPENYRDDNHDCSDDGQDLVYFPVDLDMSNLHDWKETRDRVHDQKKGEMVTVNNTDVAVFRYGDQVLATQARCPHAGGPLHLGDIEVLPDMSLCVKCPWHKWSFCVKKNINSNITRRRLFTGDNGSRSGAGECVWPPGRGQEGVGVKVFPTRVDRRRKIIKIGFESFDNNMLVNANF